jgi:hypothetical protein
MELVARIGEKKNAERILVGKHYLFKNESVPWI